MHSIVLAALAVALAAGPSWAGLAIRSSIVPMAPHCFSDTCASSSVACSVNADCNRGSLSVKSKVSLGADRTVKILLKGLTDAAGAPLTTDGVVGTDDDLLAWVLALATSDFGAVVFKLEAKNGTARLSVDASSVLPSVSELQLFGAILEPTPSCPGTNSPEDVESRRYDEDCTTGIRIAWFGMQSAPDSKTAIKGPIVETHDVCGSTGVCLVVGGFCSTNADCDSGRTVGKSSATIRGDGTLQLKLKGITDELGMPVTTDGIVGTNDDYIAYLPIFSVGGNSVTEAQVKLDLNEGSASGSFDIRAVMPPAGSEVGFSTVYLLTPPSDAASCPGGNSPEDIAARSFNKDCRDGDYFAMQGVRTTP